MGVTDPSMLTEAAQKNWTEAVEKEIEARYSWRERWGWMPAVIEETSSQLRELKQRQSARVLEESSGVAYDKRLERNPAPFPNSTNHEYGWLVTKPEYQIEKYGPWANNRRQRIEPTDDEVARARINSKDKKRIDEEDDVNEEQKSEGSASVSSGKMQARNEANNLASVEEKSGQVISGAKGGKRTSKKIPCCTDS